MINMHRDRPQLGMLFGQARRCLQGAVLRCLDYANRVASFDTIVTGSSGLYRTFYTSVLIMYRSTVACPVETLHTPEYTGYLPADKWKSV